MNDQTGKPSTSDNAHTDEEREFLKLVEAYKARTNHRHLSYVEILNIAKKAGYSLPNP